MEKVVEKMCHNPAVVFQIESRGYIKEGYFADLVIVDPNQETKVSKDNLVYKCGWSPLEGETLQAAIEKTIVNGQVVFDKGNFNESPKGQRLLFNRA